MTGEIGSDMGFQPLTTPGMSVQGFRHGNQPMKNKSRPAEYGQDAHVTNAPTECIVVRHGETVWNLEERLQGHQDSPLTQNGVRQAEAVAQRLCAEQFEALYSSDLPRARRTAEIIANRTGHPIRIDARLRERNFGIFEGLTKSEMAERYPEEYRQYLSGDVDRPVPDGESRRVKYVRVTACFEDLAAAHIGRRIVVVTHGGVLADLFRRSLELPLGAPLRCKFHNASVNTFFIGTAEWTLGTWGEIGHLR